MSYLTHPYFSKAVRVLASVKTGAQWVVAMNFVENAAIAYARESSGDTTKFICPGFTGDVLRAAQRIGYQARA